MIVKITALLLLIAALAPRQILAQRGGTSPIHNHVDLQTKAASPSVTVGRSRCNFVTTTPRYYRVEAEVTLQGVKVDEVLVSDFMIRLLRTEMGLAPCQLGLSQGSICTSGTQQLPCSDPVFNCSQNMVLSEDTYNAVVNRECIYPTANNTLVCAAIAANPAISQAVNAGLCRPSCLSGTPMATQEFPVACMSFQLGIDAPTNAAALTSMSMLGNTTLQAKVNVALANFASGVGLQFLVVNSAIMPVVGYGFFPPPPPPVRPILPVTPPPPVNTTTEQLATRGDIEYGPWSTCTPACGAGFSTRTASCFAKDGTLLPLKSCPGGSTAQIKQPCSTECIEGFFQYSYSGWTPCNATCGGGVASRQAVCTSPTGQGCSGTPEVTQMACNTNPCTSYSWALGAWSDCSAECGGGNRTRSVFCVNAAGIQVDNNSCPGRKPRSTEKCNIQACDFCATNPCLGRGTCANGACTCNEGYTGQFCETSSKCESAVVAKDLSCCESGLVDVNGSCCEKGQQLDGNGECCSQKLDACGVCGGNGAFVDMQGSCCKVADANGICCPSGLVDECGVCDGTGNSCSVKIETEIKVPGNLIQDGGVVDEPLAQFFDDALEQMGFSAASVSVTSVKSALVTSGGRRLRRSLKQLGALATPAPVPSTPAPVVTAAPVTAAPVVAATPAPVAATPAPVTAPPGPDQSLFVTVSLTPDGNATNTAPFNAAYIAAQLPSAAATVAANSSSGISLVSTPEASREGICGNNICEIGERTTVGAIDGTCPTDCGLPATACAEGCGPGGNCLPSTGVCQCYVGYQGTTCRNCSTGFVQNGEICVTAVTSQSLIDPAVLGPAGEALVTGEPPKKSSNAGAIAGGIIGALLGVALLVVVFTFVRKWWRNRQAKQQIRGAYFNRSYDYNPGDEEVGLRQRYSVATPGRTTSEKGLKTTYSVHVDVGMGSLRSQQTSSRREGGSRSGRNSLRNSARSDAGKHGRPQRGRADLDLGQSSSMNGHGDNAMHFENPLADDYVINELGGTFVMPADAEMMAYYGSRQGSPRNLASCYDSHREEEVEVVAAMPPTLPSGRDHLRASMHSMGSSSNAHPQQDKSISQVNLNASAEFKHSAALSLPPSGSEEEPGPSSSYDGVNPAASRLFFNPAYSLEGNPRDLAASIAPGYVKQAPRPVSGKGSNAIALPPAAEIEGGAGVKGSAPIVKLPSVSIPRSSARVPINVPSAEDVQERRAKLDALRAAVKALEQETAGQGGPPVPQGADASGASTSAGASLNTKQYVRPLKRQENSTPRTEFLPGRPIVPKLPIAGMSARSSRPRPPGRAAPVTKFTVPQSDGLIKAHPGTNADITPAPIELPVAIPQPQRSSPGAAIVKGAKSMFQSIKSTVTPPKAARRVSATAIPAIPPLPTKTGPGWTSQRAARDFSDVMARVEGALQGRGSARGGPSNIPSAPV